MKKTIVIIVMLFLVACSNDDVSDMPTPVLTNISSSAGVLVPAFDSMVTTYSIAVSNEVGDITVQGSALNGNITYMPENPVVLQVGQNLMKIIIENEEGSVSNIYSINIFRAPNCTLSALSFESWNAVSQFSSIDKYLNSFC